MVWRDVFGRREVFEVDIPAHKEPCLPSSPKRSVLLDEE